MTKGFVCFHRSIFSSTHFKKEPYCEIAAFSWMIAQASHKKISVRYKDHIINLERGQLACSYSDMSAKWSWDRSKVRRFMNRLVREGVIKTDISAAQAANTITICKYDEYQDIQHKDKPEPDTRPTQDRHKTDTQNNHLTTKPPNQVEDSSNELSLVPSVPDENRSRKKYPDEFELFWKAYPKRPTDTKALAFKAWTKARKTLSAEDLRMAAVNYEGFCVCQGHEPMLVQTWVNREGWTASYARDGPKPSTRANQRPGKVDEIMQARMERERMRNGQSNR